MFTRFFRHGLDSDSLALFDKVKKHSTSSALDLEQQCKNYRTNGAIMNHLQAINPSKFNYVLAMDWIGMIGYIYILDDIDEVYFGRRIGILRLPKSPKDFIDFRKTLDLLLAYQHVMLDLAMEAKAAHTGRQDLNQLCKLIDMQDDMEPRAHNNVFFSPDNPAKK